MKVFCWNLRGLNSQSRQHFVKEWIFKNKPLVGAFLETHVAGSNASTILASTVPGWRVDCNYSEAENGRIWIVWDPAISVFIYRKTAQLILCGIHDSSTHVSISVAFIYGFNTEIQRRRLHL
ncbi:hypothetical protein V5N11_014810 [Cardamine amara subsp. amara]|uniref:Uncharacterized protein n=1 Tax=Cardamine amara subsp. amara TaxID=228776 RepID=A0ABD1A4T3_CARAN